MNIEGWFDRRGMLAVAVLLAVLLSLPTLGNGLVLDDYQQRITLLGGGGGNLFEFFHRGTPATEALVQRGVLPWWTHPATKVMFYRPVAQWLMELDYRFWPASLALMHLHSVLWYALTVLIAGLAYRSILPTRWVANFAVVLFAVDAAHGGAVGWLANRNALLCLSGGLLALLCYRREELGWQALGWLLFAASMACGEATLAVTGFFFAHELCLSGRPWLRRLARLLPHALIALSWLAYWKRHGYGTAGPGFYIDPAADPGFFLSAMLYRIPAYLVGQWFLPPADIFGLSEASAARPYAWAYALVVVALLVWLLLPLLRQSRLARFFALGMLIAAVPICGSAVVGRSLWYVGFGASGLLALYIGQLRELWLSPTQLRLGKIFAGTMVVLHLFLSPLLFIAFGKAGDLLDAMMDSRRVQLPDEGPAGRQVLALSAQDYVGDITFPLLKDQALSLGPRPTRPAPDIERIRVLTEGVGEFDLQRPDADTLVVSRAAGFITLRPERYGFSAGDRFTLDDLAVSVPAVTPQRAPSTIEYHFKPGVLQGYQVIAWDHGHFVDAALPEVGRSVHIATIE